MRAAQSEWARLPVDQRLDRLRQVRTRLADRFEGLIDCLVELRGCSRAEALSSELIPSLDACRFLEREAEALLAPHKVGAAGRPFWLGAVELEVHRDPLGVVLILAPANYPFFLPSVQAFQALAAGNAAIIKPAPGMEKPLEFLLDAAQGLPLSLAQSSIETVPQLLAEGVDLVVLTGSNATGRAILRLAAETVTPVVAELSGCDAVVVEEGADLELVARALAFGLCLNHGKTCMAPRRAFVPAPLLAQLEEQLAGRLEGVARVPLNGSLPEWVAESGGRCLVGQPESGPLVVTRVRPGCRLVQEAVFEPVLSLVATESTAQAIEWVNDCPFGLTAAVFGPEARARQTAAQLRVGVVTINDLIAPTADPRLAFGGRGASGFGLTRGREGLLQMTRQRSVQVRGKGPLYHLDPPADTDEAVLEGYLQAAHAGDFLTRWRGFSRMIMAVARERAKKARARRKERRSIG
ncbi:MAG: aldehyde dehydrogenase family protein [Candidatus Eremiobacteraeota bacterium]|nr:aldehyde dehydrogenase family protein [Candidatus Eremiobacteraeota bacterium]